MSFLRYFIPSDNVNNFFFFLSNMDVLYETGNIAATREPTKVCFVDTAVYTRNRLFRILGSSKFGKPHSASLRIAEVNAFPFPTDFCNSKFYKPESSFATAKQEEAESSINEVSIFNLFPRAVCIESAYLFSSHVLCSFPSAAALHFRRKRQSWKSLNRPWTGHRTPKPWQRPWLFL
jgi:hypothetical protein